MSETDPATFWEHRYAGTDAIWSGHANVALVTSVDLLQPGRALDLGCGEGGDSIWLALQGWEVTGIDISATAIARAQAAATRAQVPAARARWVIGDLASWPDDGAYDLVTACFLQSPVELDRTGTLRRAADRLAPGGHLLVVSHAAPPPWADLHEGHEHLFLTPAQEIDGLALPASDWDVVSAQTRPRQVTGPDGDPALLDDAVVMLRRR